MMIDEQQEQRFQQVEDHIYELQSNNFRLESKIEDWVENLMTEEEIFEIAHTCGFRSEMLQDKSGYDFCACISTREELLKFARAIYEEGYDQGCYEATGGP